MARGRARDFDITRNIRFIEWLKSEMLNSVAKLFTMLASGAKASQEAMAGCLGDIIVACYLLGRRLGIHYALLDEIIEDNIRLGIIEGNDIEKSYGDLSELQKHLKNSQIEP